MTIATADLGATPTVVRKGPERVEAPRLSPSGNRVAFQMMPRDDWEIFVVDRDGSGETRRDARHPARPAAAVPDRRRGCSASSAKPRHRRSFLYDIADRHAHAAVPQQHGPHHRARVLVGAQRRRQQAADRRRARRRHRLARARRLPDGPDAHGHARRRCAPASPRNLAAEEALRAKGAAALRADRRRRSRRWSPRPRSTAIYAYEKALFDFDSKHITRPGNKLASAYLFDTYKSFGYAPEFQWFDRAQRARRPDRQRPRHAEGHRQPRADLRRQQPLRLGRDRSRRRRRLVGHGGAARDGAHHGAAAAAGDDHLRLVHRRGGRACSAAASSCAGPSPTSCRSSARSTTTWSAGPTTQRLDNTIRYSNPGIRDIQHAAAMQFTNLITYDALYYKGTDAAAYYEAYRRHRRRHRLVSGAEQPALPPVARRAREHEPPADHRGREDDGGDADAARVEPVAADGAARSTASPAAPRPCRGSRARRRASPATSSPYGPPTKPDAQQIRVSKPSATLSNVAAGHRRRRQGRQRQGPRGLGLGAATSSRTRCGAELRTRTACADVNRRAQN